MFHLKQQSSAIVPFERAMVIRAKPRAAMGCAIHDITATGLLHLRAVQPGMLYKCKVVGSFDDQLDAWLTRKPMSPYSSSGDAIS